MFNTENILNASKALKKTMQVGHVPVCRKGWLQDKKDWLHMTGAEAKPCKSSTVLQDGCDDGNALQRLSNELNGILTYP